MNDQHFELMNTLQNQREQLARFVWLFAHDEYKHERTLAVDVLDETHQFLQDIISYRDTSEAMMMFWVTHNTAVIERLNTALIAMPDAAWRESEAAL